MTAMLLEGSGLRVRCFLGASQK